MSKKNAIYVNNSILIKTNKLKDKEDLLKKIGFEFPKNNKEEVERLKREINDRKIYNKTEENLYYNQHNGNLSKLKSLYLLHFYYEGMNISEKHKLSIEAR
jgi:hypothetical protein